MAKCTICDQKKGKRECHREEADICPTCCGENRVEELCVPCEYFKSERESRRYNKVSRFSSDQMSSDFNLQSIANDIEGTFCNWDVELDGTLKDIQVLKTMQYYLDITHFGDKEYQPGDDIIEGVVMLNDRLSALVGEFSEQEINMVLGSVYFVAQRRSKGHREYVEFIKQYVGLSPAPGMRIVPGL